MCNSNCVENEIHFVTKCSNYDMLRYTLFTKAKQLDVSFDNMQLEEQFNMFLKDINLTTRKIDTSLSKEEWNFV